MGPLELYALFGSMLTLFTGLFSGWIVESSCTWEYLHLYIGQKPESQLAVLPKAYETATHSMKTYAQWTHSACCFCDLRFHNTQQVTVNPIASPRSATTRSPITPPKTTVGQLPTISLLANVINWSTSLLVVAGWFVPLVMVCSRHVWRVWLIVLLITELITSWCVLHTTPRSMELSTDWSAMSTQWMMLFIITQLLIGAVPLPKVVTDFEPTK